MTEPIQVGELLPGVLQEVIDRAGPGYDRWAEQVAAAGSCTHPVRLRGRVERTILRHGICRRNPFPQARADRQHGGGERQAHLHGQN